MRDIPSGLAAHLAESATTLCHAWRLTRRDGTVFGFTDHDRDLSFDGTDFAARTGLEAAEATAELGFAVGEGRSPARSCRPASRRPTSWPGATTMPGSRPGS